MTRVALAIFLSSVILVVAKRLQTDGEIPYGNDGEFHDMFGTSCAVSSKYMVIGAPVDWCNGCLSNFKKGCYLHDTGTSGGMHMYDRVGSAWAPYSGRPSYQDNVLFAGRAGDKVGSSIAIHGEYVVVGAPLGNEDPTSRSKVGAAYIFYRESQFMWTRQAKLENGVEEDKFGCSVAISGDYVLVGAWGDESAHMYVRSSDDGNRTVWTLQSRLAQEPGKSGGRRRVSGFGISVAISGDYAAVGDDRQAKKWWRKGAHV